MGSMPQERRHPGAHLLGDHLDAALAMGEDLLTEKVRLDAPPGPSALRNWMRQNRDLNHFLTTVRTLETFATGRRQLESGERLSTLYIRPGFPFQVVDGLFTNFHMPRTSLLVMLAAFVGRDRLFAAYTEALETGYRFLSFGDSMLVLPEGMMGGGGDANEAPVSVSL